MLNTIWDQQNDRPVEKKWQFKILYILEYIRLSEQSLVVIYRKCWISVTKNITCTSFKTYPY